MADVEGGDDDTTEMLRPAFAKATAGRQAQHDTGKYGDEMATRREGRLGSPPLRKGGCTE